MAGMPPELINRANEVLSNLEEKHIDAPLQENIKKVSTPTQQLQLNIFDAHSDVFKQIREKLDLVDINRLTPVEALLKLSEIKNMIG
jgi:DNA mismatch repair protein MutS